MASKTSQWRTSSTVCRCCLSDGCYKDISTEYFWMGTREVYSEMLSKTLDVTISYSQTGGPNSNSRLICETCITRLRDASDFKRQVLECEKMFMKHLDSQGTEDTEATPNVFEAETADTVKVEYVKDEKDLSDNDGFDDKDFGFDNDDDDDLDDEPLMKLATKQTKKESIDLIDIIKTKSTEKRKSTSNTKATTAKKAKTKDVKPSASKTEKGARKKGPLAVDCNSLRTSIWQMTKAERQNAATFLEYTNIRPFFYQQANFKCFYCDKVFPEIHSVLQHTNDHKTPNRTELLKDHLKKGKRVIKVDISGLKCLLCEQRYSDLDDIRKHLNTTHKKEFKFAGNGLMPYDLSFTNGLLTCHKCGMNFNSFFLLNSHMNAHFNVVCETCGLGFVSHQRLMHHRAIHQNGAYKCEKCPEVFPNKLKLRYHMLKKHEVTNAKKLKPLKCPHCLERFAEHYKKMTHLKEVHGITFTFECNICKAVLPTRRALTEHTTKLHTQRIQCHVCGKCFGTTTLLKMHERGHTGEKNFFCNICQKAYMHQRTLRQHMRSHGFIGEKNFFCNICQKSYLHQRTLSEHMRIHRPKPPYAE